MGTSISRGSTTARPTKRRAQTRIACGALACIAGVALSLGCGQTGQAPVRFPIEAASAGRATTTLSGWLVELDQAQVGFGPVYFCATAGASSDLCPESVQELDSVVAFDAIAAMPVPLGEITGVTGSVRSVTFDYGINWFTTYRQPRPATAAPGGHSAHFAGRATKGAVVLPFVADVDVAPQLAGDLAVQGLSAAADVDVATSALTVTFAPAAWWRQVDFDALAAGMPVASATSPLVVAAGSAAYNAVVTAMTATNPPAFRWR